MATPNPSYGFTYENLSEAEIAAHKAACEHEARLEDLEQDVIEAAIECYAENRGVFGTYDYQPGYLKIEGPEADAHNSLLAATVRLIREREGK